MSKEEIKHIIRRKYENLIFIIGLISFLIVCAEGGNLIIKIIACIILYLIMKILESEEKHGKRN